MISNKKAKRKKRGSDTPEDPSDDVVVVDEANENNQGVDPLLRHPSIFDFVPNNDYSVNGTTESSMNPKSLITGFYGSRGERIRHVVHEGALRLPQEALDLLDDTQESAESSSKKNVKYELPQLDSVKRPSLDENVNWIKVTTLYGEVIPGGTALLPLIQSVAKNQIITRKTNNDMLLESQQQVERIRGGGQDDNDKLMSDEVNIKKEYLPSTTESSSSQNLDTQNPHTTNLGSSTSFVPQSSSSNDVAMASTALSDEQVNDSKANVEEARSAATSLDQVPNNATESSFVAESLTEGDSRRSPAPVEYNKMELPTHQSDLVTDKSGVTEFPSVSGEAKIESSNLDEAYVQISLPFSSETKEAIVQNSVGVGEVTRMINLSAAPMATLSSPPSVSGPEMIGKESNIKTEYVVSTETKPETLQPQVKPLKKRPAPQWEQHIPSANDEVQIDLHAKMPVAAWFRKDRPSDLEMTVLSEWFDGSAPHRTPESYIESRNSIISMSQQLGHNRYITATMARKAIPGDVGSIIRLHSFLTTFALINEDAINDTAPTPFSFIPKVWKENSKIIPVEDPWSDDSICNCLLSAVVSQSHKKQKTNETAVSGIDWTEVAKEVGRGVLPSDCERKFLSLNIESVTADLNDDSLSTDMPMTFDETNVNTDQNLARSVSGRDSFSIKRSIKREFIEDIVSKCSSKVVSAVTTAALDAVLASSRDKEATHDNLQQAQDAGVLGVIVSQSANEARSQEDYVSRLLSEIVELRMQKLENRMALLDDVEGMLEAERVTLELERRDLYTARCRHWFGGT